MPFRVNILKRLGSVKDKKGKPQGGAESSKSSEEKQPEVGVQKVTSEANCKADGVPKESGATAGDNVQARGGLVSLQEHQERDEGSCGQQGLESPDKDGAPDSVSGMKDGDGEPSGVNEAENVDKSSVCGGTECTGTSEQDRGECGGQHQGGGGGRNSCDVVSEVVREGMGGGSGAELPGDSSTECKKDSVECCRPELPLLAEGVNSGDCVGTGGTDGSTLPGIDEAEEEVGELSRTAPEAVGSQIEGGECDKDSDERVGAPDNNGSSGTEDDNGEVCRRVMDSLLDAVVSRCDGDGMRTAVREGVTVLIGGDGGTATASEMCDPDTVTPAGGDEVDSVAVGHVRETIVNAAVKGEIDGDDATVSGKSNLDSAIAGDRAEKEMSLDGAGTERWRGVGGGGETVKGVAGSVCSGLVEAEEDKMADNEGSGTDGVDVAEGGTGGGERELEEVAEKGDDDSGAGVEGVGAVGSVCLAPAPLRMEPSGGGSESSSSDKVNESSERVQPFTESVKERVISERVHVGEGAVRAENDTDDRPRTDQVSAGVCQEVTYKETGAEGSAIPREQIGEAEDQKESRDELPDDGTGGHATQGASVQVGDNRNAQSGQDAAALTVSLGPADQHPGDKVKEEDQSLTCGNNEDGEGKEAPLQQEVTVRELTPEDGEGSVRPCGAAEKGVCEGTAGGPEVGRRDSAGHSTRFGDSLSPEVQREADLAVGEELEVGLSPNCVANVVSPADSGHGELQDPAVEKGRSERATEKVQPDSTNVGRDVEMSPTSEECKLDSEDLSGEFEGSGDASLQSSSGSRTEQGEEEEVFKPNWKVGYLEVKLPTKSRGRGQLKAWKRRRVVVHPDEFGHSPAIMLNVYPVAGGNASKLEPLFWKTVSANNSVVYRSQSRTHRYAFSIAVGGEALLHLAATSETESQEWMAAIRTLLWPPSPVVALERVLSSSFNVSIIDDNFSCRAGLLGAYGNLEVTSRKLILINPEKGHVLQEWYLNTLHRFHLLPQHRPLDKFKVVAMRTGPNSSTGSGEIQFFCHEAVDMLQTIASTIHTVLQHRNAVCRDKYKQELKDLAEWMEMNDQPESPEKEDYYKVPPKAVRSLLDIPKFAFDRPLSADVTRLPSKPSDEFDHSALTRQTSTPNFPTESPSSEASQSSPDDFLNCSSSCKFVIGKAHTSQESDSEDSDEFSAVYESIE